MTALPATVTSISAPHLAHTMMLFCRRNYLEFSFSIGYDDWNKDFAVRLMVPFLLVSFGYEFQQAEILAMMQEDVENGDE